MSRGHWAVDKLLLLKRTERTRLVGTSRPVLFVTGLVRPRFRSIAGAQPNASKFARILKRNPGVGFQNVGTGIGNERGSMENRMCRGYCW